MQKSVAVALDVARSYDPAGRSWTVLLGLNEQWCKHSGIGALSRLYVEAGTTEKGEVFHYSMLVIDPYACTQQSIEHIWGRRFQFHSASGYVEIGDRPRLVMAGGFREGDAITNRTQGYDINDGTWITLANIPRPVAGHDCIPFWPTGLLILGGNNGQGKACREYDPDQDVWITQGETVRECRHAEAETIRNNTYILGIAAVLQTRCNTVDAWTILTSPPCHCSNATAGLTFQDDIYFLMSVEAHGIACVYSTLSDSWRMESIGPEIEKIPEYGHTFDWA